jgi:hypothetical protein
MFLFVFVFAYCAFYVSLFSSWRVCMTQYYKGERISELLDRIEYLKAMIDSNRDGIETEDDVHRLVEGEATLVIMKAKLTALQGE